MNSTGALTQRMTAIARVLEADPDARALLGLGSVGEELDRLDEWSDLDFFVIVNAGAKERLLADPAWLGRVHPVAYLFRNTRDGFKLMWEDGIFAEMAIFHLDELEQVPFAPGKTWWARDDVPENRLRPRNESGRIAEPPGADYCVNELLTCLYVGLCRYRRGERLSAWRFIQSHCLDRTLELAELWEPQGAVPRDQYSRERRVERRYPTLVPVLEEVLLGYQRIPESALNLLAWLESRVPVNETLAREIRKLAAA